MLRATSIRREVKIWPSGRGLVSAKPETLEIGRSRLYGLARKPTRCCQLLAISDFGRDGGTNVQGPFVKIDYMLFPRLTITAKNHFVSFIDRPKGESNSLLHRFQLDAQVAF